MSKGTYFWWSTPHQSLDSMLDAPYTYTDDIILYFIFMVDNTICTTTNRKSIPFISFLPLSPFCLSLRRTRSPWTKSVLLRIYRICLLDVPGVVVAVSWFFWFMQKLFSFPFSVHIIYIVSLYNADATCCVDATAAAAIAVVTAINGVVRWNAYSPQFTQKTRNNILQDVTLADSLLSVMYVASHWRGEMYENFVLSQLLERQYNAAHKMSRNTLSTCASAQRWCWQYFQSPALQPLLAILLCGKQEQKAIDSFSSSSRIELCKYIYNIYRLSFGGAGCGSGHCRAARSFIQYTNMHLMKINSI